jgi:hypothetical protein
MVILTGCQVKRQHITAKRLQWQRILHVEELQLKTILEQYGSTRLKNRHDYAAQRDGVKWEGLRVKGNTVLSSEVPIIQRTATPDT